VAGPSAFFAGLIVGAILLAVLFAVLNRVARKIPLRPLFVVTSAFLFLMALKFIGDAILEFQEQNFIPTTPLQGGSWLETIGLNPTVEALTVQCLIGIFVIAAFSLVRREQMLSRQQVVESHG
jgi:high-affinity iron transporter